LPTGYLDTNLLSGLVKEDVGVAELAGLRDLLRRRKAGEIELVTSDVADQELARIPEEFRSRHEDIYLLLDDVRTVAEEQRFASLPLLLNSYIEIDPLLEQLAEILPDHDDARHIFQAAKNGIDYFLTCDRKTILSRADAIEAVAPIKVRSPRQLADEMAS
jgi:predicted nucleic acid-binding protein